MIQDKTFVFTLSLLSISGSTVVSVMYLRPRNLESMMTLCNSGVTLFSFRCPRKTGTLFYKTFYPHYTIAWNSQHNMKSRSHTRGKTVPFFSADKFQGFVFFFFAFPAHAIRVAVKWSHARSVAKLWPNRTHRAAYELVCHMHVFMYTIHFCSHALLKWIARWIIDWKIERSQGICV